MEEPVCLVKLNWIGKVDEGADGVYLYGIGMGHTNHWEVGKWCSQSSEDRELKPDRRRELLGFVTGRTCRTGMSYQGLGGL